MAKTVLQGGDLTDDRIKAEIQHRATVRSQGAYAMIEKNDGEANAAFLIIDNGRILIRDSSGTKDFVRAEIESIEFG